MVLVATSPFPMSCRYEPTQFYGESPQLWTPALCLVFAHLGWPRMYIFSFYAFQQLAKNTRYSGTNIIMIIYKHIYIYKYTYIQIHTQCIHDAWCLSPYLQVPDPEWRNHSGCTRYSVVHASILHLDFPAVGRATGSYHKGLAHRPAPNGVRTMPAPAPPLFKSVLFNPPANLWPRQKTWCMCSNHFKVDRKLKQALKAPTSCGYPSKICECWWYTPCSS